MGAELSLLAAVALGIALAAALIIAMIRCPPEKIPEALRAIFGRGRDDDRDAIQPPEPPQLTQR
jgi:hypothetical protein